MIAPHVAVSDYRDPLWTFSLPAGGGPYKWASLFILRIDDSRKDHDDVDARAAYGIFWLSDVYWLEVLLLVCATVVVAALTASIVYAFIVGPKKSDTSTAFFVGYGILLPFWLAWPLVINPLLGFQNLLFKFIVGGVIPTLVEFRLLEAIHGCCPDYATTSMTDFVTYFASVLLFERDPKTKKPIHTTNTIRMHHFLRFLVYVMTTGALQSLLTPFQDFNVFGDEIGPNGWLGWNRFMTWQLYANSFLHATLFMLYLAMYCQGLTFFWNLVTGYQTQRVMNNPLGGSTSPSDFWGRRWNMLVQSVLKGGVYKPLRKYGFSPTFAAMATFLMSGLFHEWLVFGFFSTACAEDPNSPSCYQPLYGGALAFFAWQAMLIALEYLLGRHPAVQAVSQRLPTPIRTFLIIALGIPLAHCFCEPYVRSNFFRHGQMALPMIIRI